MRPKLIIIAGPNGSGKTTFTPQMLEHDWADGCLFINPDEIAKNDFGDWNSPAAVMKAVVGTARGVLENGTEHADRIGLFCTG